MTGEPGWHKWLRHQGGTLSWAQSQLGDLGPAAPSQPQERGKGKPFLVSSTCGFFPTIFMYSWRRQEVLLSFLQAQSSSPNRLNGFLQLG